MFIALTVFLLFFGLLFPAVSLLTGLMYWQPGTGWREGPSPIFVPIFGPCALTSVILLHDYPSWLIPAAWFTDLGTLVFLWALPQLIKEEWQLSRFTCVLRLRGSRDNERAVVTLHTSGKYLLRKEWMQPRGEEDWICLGEPGTYVESQEGYELKSFHGVTRCLTRRGNGSFLVVTEKFEQEFIKQYSLAQWILNE